MWSRALIALLLCSCPLTAAEVVHIGAYVNDIQNLDLKSHSYSVDLYLYFKWSDPKIDPTSTLETMNAFEQWGQVRTKSYDKPMKLKSGELYQVVRIQGRFSHKFMLEDYPFDTQVLVMAFEDSVREVQDLKYEVDGKLTVSPELRLPGFKLGTPQMRVKEFPYPTAFGETGTHELARHSRAIIEMPIVRPVVTYGLKLMLPILCVIFCAALMFLFHPKYVDSRVGIGITALLTIVALQITLNEDLPEVDYLVLMDKIYICAYLFVIAGLGVIMKSTFLLDRDDFAGALRLDRRSLSYLLVAFTLAVVGLIAIQ